MTSTTKALPCSPSCLQILDISTSTAYISALITSSTCNITLLHLETHQSENQLIHNNIMASTTDSVRSADIEFLFEALNYAAAPLTVSKFTAILPSQTMLTFLQINIALLGAAKDAKPNTLAKRISMISKRYNLNITTTTKSEGSIPVTPKKPKAAAAKTPASRKRKVSTKIEKESEAEGDEVEMNGKRSEEAEHFGQKQKIGNGDARHGDDGGLDDGVGEDLA